MLKVILPATLLALSLQAPVIAAASDEGVAIATPAKSAKQLATQQALQLKLSSVEGFNADFTQRVIDADGNELQQSNGKLAVKRPNLIHWQTVAPDETLVVSDGETLWFYNPFVEQVSAFTVDTAVTNTPILLLSGLNENAWKDYAVKQINEHEFDIQSLNDNAQVKGLHLLFSDNTLIKFTVVDATGQISHFDLTNVVSKPLPDMSLFEFTLPEGVDLDDQR